MKCVKQRVLPAFEFFEKFGLLFLLFMIATFQPKMILSKKRLKILKKLLSSLPKKWNVGAFNYYGGQPIYFPIRPIRSRCY